MPRLAISQHEVQPPNASCACESSCSDRPIALVPTQAPQQSFLGIAVDVAYLPLDDAATAAPMLQVMIAAACWPHDRGIPAAAAAMAHLLPPQHSALELMIFPANCCWQDLADVLREAVAAAGGRLRQVPDSAAAFQLPATHGARHRAAQYVQLQQLFGE